MGPVKAAIHRRPDDSWRLKSATVSQASDGKYYVSVLFEFDDIENTYVADMSNAIGQTMPLTDSMLTAMGKPEATTDITARVIKSLQESSAGCRAGKDLKRMRKSQRTI